MKKLYVFLPIIWFASCTDDGPTNSTYIPQVENQWQDESDANHIFNLSTDDEGLNKGLFSGGEVYPDSNIDDNNPAPIIGFYINRDIEFNISRPSGTYKFTGKIINENRMEFNSVFGKLVLVK